VSVNPAAPTLLRHSPANGDVGPEQCFAVENALTQRAIIDTSARVECAGVGGPTPVDSRKKELREMNRKVRFAVFWGLAAIGACDGSDPNDEATAPVNIALLQNYPYISGGPTYQAAGTNVGATMFNGKAYLGFVRTDQKIQIFVESDLGNNTGQSVTNVVFTDTSNTAPSLIVYNGYIYMFYVGQNQHFYLKRSADGTTWGTTVDLDQSDGGHFLYRPAPVVFESTLIVFVGYNLSYANTNYIFQYNIGSDGLSASGPWSTTTAGQRFECFSNNTCNCETSNFASGATVWNGILYLAWAGATSGRPLFIKHFDPNIGQWSGDTSISAQNGIPSLFPLPTEIEMVYYGNDNRIWRTYTTDGTTFTGTTRDNSSLPYGPPAPFLAYGASDVWVFYKGANGQLYTSIE
jgi:hypothetical protein